MMNLKLYFEFEQIMNYEYLKKRINEQSFNFKGVCNVFL